MQMIRITSLLNSMEDMEGAIQRLIKYPESQIIKNRLIIYKFIIKINSLISHYTHQSHQKESLITLQQKSDIFVASFLGVLQKCQIIIPNAINNIVIKYSSNSNEKANQNIQIGSTDINQKVNKDIIQNKHEKSSHEQPTTCINSICEINQTKQAGDQHCKNNIRCFGCLEQIQQGSEICANQQVYSVINLSFDKTVYEQNLKKKICGLLNCGGGYLLVCGGNRDSIKSVESCTWTIKQTDTQIYSKQKLQKIVQDIQSIAHRHIIPNSFNKNSKIIKILQKGNSQSKVLGSVILIIFEPVINIKAYIHSYQQRQKLGLKTYFVQKKVQQAPSSYSTYLLNYQLMGYQQDLLILSDPQSLYSIIRKKIILSSILNASYFLQNLFPYHPNQNKDWKLCLAQYRNNINFHIYKQVLSSTYGKFQAQPTKAPTQQIDLKYKSLAVLIFPNNSDDKSIEQIKQNFRIKKMSSYTIFKPYTQYRSMTNKSVWFISHDYSLNKIKSQITGCVSNKKKVQAVITCTRYMHALKIGDYVFEQYIKLFCYLFQNQQPFYFKSKKTNICTDPNQSIKPPKTPESSKLTNKSKEEGCDYFIKYRNMQQVIFSFVYLDNFRVKCTFVKQKQFIEQYNFQPYSYPNTGQKQQNIKQEQMQQEQIF